jgi:hypothetical protein
MVMLPEEELTELIQEHAEYEAVLSILHEIAEDQGLDTLAADTRYALVRYRKRAFKRARDLLPRITDKKLLAGLLSHAQFPTPFGPVLAAQMLSLEMP